MKKTFMTIFILLIFSSLGFTQTSAKVTLAGEGTYVTLEGSILTINSVPTFSGMNIGVVVVTDAASYTVLAANTGKVHVITDLSQNTVIDLPAEAAGLFYRFIYSGGAAEAHDHVIDSESNTNFFIGGVSFLDLDAGSGADEVHLGIYSDGNSNSKITINNMATGTNIDFYCDGTNWYITGSIVADTIPVIADQ